MYDLSRKKEAKWHVGRSRSGDISCRKMDVSCRRPRKARKICYTERRKLKNCPGAPRTRREDSLREVLCPREINLGGERNEQEEIYEEAYLELSHGAGPVPDAAAHGGAGRGDGGDGTDVPGHGGIDRPGKRGKRSRRSSLRKQSRRASLRKRSRRASLRKRSRRISLRKRSRRISLRKRSRRISLRNRKNSRRILPQSRTRPWPPCRR